MQNFLETHPWIIILFIIIVLIDGTLKLISLWRSARNQQLAWFVCLGIFNTIGILPLVYLIFFSRKQTT